MRPLFRILCLSLAAVSVQAVAAETVKIGFIDPLSGPFANVGEWRCATSSDRSGECARWRSRRHQARAGHVR